MRNTIAAIIALACAAPAAHAQVKTPPRPITDPKSVQSPANPAATPVPLADLSNTRGLFDAVWSADGKQVFLVTNLSGRFNIWRTDAAGSWPLQITQSDETQAGLAVSPNGKTLFFEEDKGGNEYSDLFAVPTSGGAPVNLTNTPDTRESGLLVAANGATGAFSHKLKAEGQINLAVIDLASRQVRLLTKEADPKWGWSPVAFVDGGRALIANRRFTDDSASEVWRVDVASGRATKLLGAKDVVYAAGGATPDGSVIAVTTDEKTGQPHAGIYTVAAKSWRWLKPTPWEQTAGDVSPDGRAMVVRTLDDVRSSLSLVDLATGAERPVPTDPGLVFAYGRPTFSPDGKSMLLVRSGADSPADLFVADVAAGTTRPITALAMATLTPAALPKSQVVTYRSFDGTPISAIVTIPFNLQRDGSAPGIVLPHGGPTGQAQDGFSRTATALASRGYVVIQPNFRGSTGYGEAFQKANFKDLGGGDLKDTVAAKRFLVDTGFVDPKRVGITGASYGGFMTLMAIGRTPDEFAAAVQLFGIINWRTMYRDEDAQLQAYQATLLGTPDTDPSVYDAASPLTYLNAAKAPLLQLQGENDIRVPRGQAQEVADMLKTKGNVVETVFYPAEGHGFYKRENQIDSLRRTVEWFDKYLKPVTAAPPAAQGASAD